MLHLLQVGLAGLTPGLCYLVGLFSTFLPFFYLQELGILMEQTKQQSREMDFLLGPRPICAGGRDPPYSWGPGGRHPSEGWEVEVLSEQLAGSGHRVPTPSQLLPGYC